MWGCISRDSKFLHIRDRFMNGPKKPSNEGSDGGGGNRANRFFTHRISGESDRTAFEKAFGFVSKVPWEKISIWTLFLLLLWVLRDFFLLIVLTFVFSYIANYIVSHLSERWKMNRRVLTVLMYIVFLGLILGPGQWFAERVILQGRPIARDAGTYFQNLFQDGGTPEQPEDVQMKRKKNHGASTKTNGTVSSSTKRKKTESDGDATGKEKHRSTSDSADGVPADGKTEPGSARTEEAAGDGNADQRPLSKDGKKPSDRRHKFSPGDSGQSKPEETDGAYGFPRQEIAKLRKRLDSYEKQLENVNRLKNEQTSPLINEWIQLLQTRQDLLQRKIETLSAERQMSRQTASVPEPEVTDIERVPPQVQNLVDNILRESLSEDALNAFKQYQLYKNLVLQVNKIWEDGVPFVTRWANYIFINALNFSFAVLLAVMFSFFIVFDIPTLKHRLSELEDSRIRDFYLEIAPSLASFSTVMGRSIQAQAMIAIVNTILTGLGIYLLQLPNRALLTGIVFVCSFVPVLGVIISTIPIGIVALAKGGPGMLLVVIVLIIAIHVIETYLLNPNIYGVHMRMHPLMVLIVLLVSEHFFGLWGLILGVPVSVYLLEVVILQTEPDELFEAG